MFLDRELFFPIRNAPWVHAIGGLNVIPISFDSLSILEGSALSYGTIKWYHRDWMSGKHQRTLQNIFKDPVQSNIPWREIENLFVSLGGQISEGRGSRIRVELKGVLAVFHRPHPQKETDKGAVKSVRRFLTNAGVKP